VKPQHKVRTLILLGACVCTFAHNLSAQQPAQEPAQQTAPRPAQQPDKKAERFLNQGVIVGGGAIGANKMGPGLLGGWWLELPLASWAYLSGGPTLSYVFNSYSNFTDYGPYPYVHIYNTDTQRILGLSLDAFLGVEVLPSISIELGGNLGVAVNAAKTTACGSDTYPAGVVGLEGGLALRVGQRKQYLASAHAVAVTLPVVRCSNYYTGNGDQTGPYMYHEHDFETLGAVLRLGILL
jgi:hypothetical protein